MSRAAAAGWLLNRSPEAAAMHDPPSVFASWANFYVITGSSAAALTGLMFVVVTLVAGDTKRPPRDGFAVFSTPTVMHFCAAFLISGMLSAPWHSLLAVRVPIGLAGLCGIAYVLVVMQRTRRLESYDPVPEDWLWFTILPLLAYVLIAVTGLALSAATHYALFALASATLLLIFIGIHNAWDVVTYLAIERPHRPEEQ